ncbi:cysteine synthase A [Candidatus Micrarchaeota archaeon]|nr:cysteine synthase A [Candidatus Micrarchaeota archaeon]
MANYENVLETIGGTPLVKLNSIVKGLKPVVYAKLESRNPAFSVKDRIALNMVAEAEKKGLLKPGSVIVEPTSGNTGIGLAMVAAVKGYTLKLTMPETMSLERRALLRALGAEIILTPGSKGMKGAVEKAEELAREGNGVFIPQQFKNAANVKIHRETTGPEIWADTGGKITALVSGVGTGGTITGAGGFLKEKNPSVKLFAVEPEASPVLSGGQPGPHKIQGIGAGFIPDILNLKIVDEIIKVSDDNAFETARRITREEGILAGISSGAALWAALEVSKKLSEKDVVVVVFPDSGERYITTDLFKPYRAEGEWQ